MPDDRTLRCVVLTCEQALLDEQTDFVVVPGYDGQIGIMYNHAPFLTKLGQGAMRLRAHGEWRPYFISGGFLRVRANVVTVLTETAIRLEEIDRAEVEKQLQEALERPITDDASLEARSQAVDRAKTLLRMVQ